MDSNASVVNRMTANYQSLEKQVFQPNKGGRTTVKVLKVFNDRLWVESKNPGRRYMAGAENFLKSHKPFANHNLK